MNENGKRDYVRPVLVNYGSIKQLTLAGAQSHLQPGGTDWEALTGEGTAVTVS